MQLPSLFLLRGSHCAVSCLCVGRHELLGLFEGLSLFGSNAVVAAVSEAAGICIGHSENVVGLLSLIVSTVTWNWFAELFALLFLINSVEDLVSLFERLFGRLVTSDVRATCIECLSVLFECLLSYNVVIHLICASVEFPDGHSVDWLLQNYPFQIRHPGKRLNYLLTFL